MKDGANVAVSVIREDKTKVVNEKDIADYLTAKGVKCSLSGFDYLVEAIAGRLDGTYTNATCAMYKKIGDKYEKTPSMVERAIRHAVGKAEDGKMSNREFIATAVNYFKYN